MNYIKPLRPFYGFTQTVFPTVYDDSLSYYESINKMIYTFNQVIKDMNDNYEAIDEIFTDLVDKANEAINRAETAADAAEAAQAAAELAEAGSKAAQALAEAAQKKAEAAQAAAETAEDGAQTAETNAVAAQKAAEAARALAEAARDAAKAAQTAAEAARDQSKNYAEQSATSAADAAESAKDSEESANNAKNYSDMASAAADSALKSASDAATNANAAVAAKTAAEAAQAAAEAAQSAAEAAQAAAEASEDESKAAQAAAEAAQKLSEAARDAAQAAQSAAETAKTAAETAATNAAASATQAANSASAAAESASNADADATNAAESATHAANSATQAAASAELAGQHAEAADDSAKDAATSAAEIKNALDNYYDKTESDDTFVKKTGDTMTGDLVMNNSHVEGSSSGAYFNSFPEDIEDLNNLNVNGYYASRENLTNSPKFSYYFLYNNIVPGNYNITQIAFQRITGNNIAIRNYNNNNNTWSDWTYFTTQDDITGNYLPLAGGTMTGNITMSNNSGVIGNASTSDTLKLNKIPDNTDLNTINTPGFYGISSGYNIPNAPEDLIGRSKAFSCFVFPWWYPENRGFAQLLFGGYGNTVTGVYLRMNNKIEPNSWGNWVRLDNVIEEPADGSPIFYKRVYTTDNQYFANIYRIAGDATKARVEIFDNSPQESYDVTLELDDNPIGLYIQHLPRSAFAKDVLPFQLSNISGAIFRPSSNIQRVTTPTVTSETFLITFGYNFSFDGYGDYIYPFIQYIFYKNSNLGRTQSSSAPVLITTIESTVSSEWTW